MRVAPCAIALAGLFHLAAPGSLAAQDEPSAPPADELAEARVIIEAMLPPDKREQILLDLASTVAKQASAGFMSGPLFEEPGIKAIVDRFLVDLPMVYRPLFAEHMPKILEATAIAYTREFTFEELRDIAAFARTPSGQRYFLRIQALQSDPDVAAASSAMFTDLAPIAKAAGLKLGQEAEAYLNANPEALERLRNAGVGADK
jgi:sugar phosphate isomerase/epimerase